MNEEKDVNKSPLNLSMLNDPYMMEAAIMIKDKKKAEKQKTNKILSTKEFLEKDIDVKNISFVPSGDFGIFMSILFVPYVTGFIFMFFYLFDENFDSSLYMLEKHSFFLLWAIGYELIAFIFVLWTIKMVIFSSTFMRNP